MQKTAFLGACQRKTVKIAVIIKNAVRGSLRWHYPDQING